MLNIAARRAANVGILFASIARIPLILAIIGNLVPHDCEGSQMTITSDVTAVGEELLFPDYDTSGFYDEMFDEQGRPRTRAELLAWRLNSLAAGELTTPAKSGRHGPC